VVEFIMQTLDVLRSRRTEILATASRHGARNVRVFGSVARGDDTSISDIDLLVDFSPERSLYDLVGLQFDIESLLGRRADIVTEASLNALLRERILAEASPL
jgi:predicted nucleotidyltransferase